MTNYIEQLIREWADDEMTAINLKVDHLERRLFKTYEPNKFVEGEFWARCEAWIKNVGEVDDKKTLLRLLTRIFYVGPTEFEELFRCAYEGPIARWLADRSNIDVCADGAKLALQEAAADTWFCPVTDSFRINSFYHINNLPATSNLRPDWSSLFKLGDPQRILDYCAKNKIKRLVLLEDFVGGGSQSCEAVYFAATQFPPLEVLFVPMIICPAGAKNFRALEASVNALMPGALSFDPVLELHANAFFTPTESCLPGKETDSLRKLISDTYAMVSGGVVNDKPYHPYGFPEAEPTGGLVVMYTNTPDNTLPLIHWRPLAQTWQPVFPRHSRV